MTLLLWDGLAAGAEPLRDSPAHMYSLEWPVRPEVTLQEIYLLATSVLPTRILSTALFISAINKSRDAGVFFLVLDKMAPPAAPAAAAAEAETERGMSVSRKFQILWQDLS